MTVQCRFLTEMAKSYEIVVFSAGLPYVVDPVLGALDPQGSFFMWRLYRDCTTYRAGKYIKDISRLNRDLTKVVMIDDDVEYVSDQPENAIVVTRWEGDREDTELLDLIPFLKGLDTNRKKGRIVDFREEIARYRGENGTLADLVKNYNMVLIEELKEDQKKQNKMQNLPGGRVFGKGAVGAEKAAILEAQRLRMKAAKGSMGGF